MASSSNKDWQPGKKLAGLVRAGLRRIRRQPKRVLLLKTWNDRLGDLVLISGTLRQYRELYADCHLELACPDPFMKLFQHCPHLDAVVPLSSCFQTLRGKNRPSWLNAGRVDRVISLRRTPRAQDYDLLESFRPAWCAGVSGDHLLIEPSAATPREANLDCAVPVPLHTPPTQELEVQASLLRAQGASITSPEEIWPEFWTTPADAVLPEKWLATKSPGPPVVVCAPGASSPIRAWKTERFIEVVSALAPCTVVLMGSSGDSAEAAAIAATSLPGVHFLNLMGQTSILELVETIRRADLVLGMESAVVHIGTALRKPTICLAGGGHWGRFVPWGMKGRTRVLTHQLECFGCGWTCSRPTVECILGIGADEVIRNARELLQQAEKEKQV